MTYLLDTDHISLIARGGVAGHNIEARLDRLADVDIIVSIVSYEEQMRGWLAEIAATSSVDKQGAEYLQLAETLTFYCSTPIAPFDGPSITTYKALKSQRLRVGTMDLKIAAIALSRGAVLLSRNAIDFRQVPGLIVEDWTV